MTIQAVTIEDAGELLAVYKPYVENTAVTFEYDVPSLEEFAGRIRAISAKFPYIKAVNEQGEIVGYAYAGPFKGRRAYDWAVETTIYLRRDMRGQGIGRILYTALEASLRDMGILNMNACIASPGGEDEHLDDSSIRFHTKMGFEPVGLFHDCGYKFGKWYNMTWMEKMLGPHEEYPGEVAFGRWQLVDK